MLQGISPGVLTVASKICMHVTGTHEPFLLMFAVLLRRVLTRHGYLSGDEACQSQDWETHKELCSRLCLVNDAEASELIPRSKLSPDEYGDRMVRLSHAYEMRNV